MLLGLLLLASLLFIQQASRFAELFVAVRLPATLMLEIAEGLIPGVIAFALPLAVLAGTLVGFSRMGSDSELVAMRGAGLGTWGLIWPILLIGAVSSAATLYTNLEGAPQAARTLKQTSLRAALYKLDSPVDPRSFNTEIPGYVIYVRDGDKTLGQWGRVFLFSQQRDGSVQIVTARSGRIDAAAEQSELVLSDAVAIKRYPRSNVAGNENQYILERFAQLRVTLDTGRRTLLERLRSDQPELDEMSWQMLVAQASQGAKGWREAAVLLHRRLSLSALPMVFAMLGAGLGLRVRRGGRGVGILLSILAAVVYYLLALAGEQLARAGTVPTWVGGWLSLTLTLALSLMLLASDRGFFRWGWPRIRFGRFKRLGRLVSGREARHAEAHARLLSFPSLLDLSLMRTLFLSLAVAYISLISLFLIFTSFEMWRFAATMQEGWRLLARYLFFLLPLASTQLLPASVLLSTLATYTLLAKRSEAIAWWASGQSIYRLMLPGLLFALGVGICLWLIQERLMPQANARQDSLRLLIRSRGAASRATTSLGRQWLAEAGTWRLYSYEFDNGSQSLKEPEVYDFDEEGVHLRRITTGQSGRCDEQRQLSMEGAEAIGFQGLRPAKEEWKEVLASSCAEGLAAFKPAVNKPSQLSARQLSAYLKLMKKRGEDVTSLAVTLQRRYADPLSVLLMALAGAPLALSFGRRHAALALCLAVVAGLSFWAVTGGFQQLGMYGFLPAPVAVWSPPVLFAAISLYLTFRART